MTDDASPEIDKLIEDLKSDDWRVRKSAAEALGKIGDMHAVEPLIELLEDEDEDVRASAKEALKKLGHEVK